MKKRHLFFWWLLKPLTTVFVRLKFGYTYDRAGDLPESYIVLSNHVTDYDMLLVAASFKKQMYFVGSEHIARWKLLYIFLRYAFEPILRYKGTLGASTVKDVLKAAREGKSVCLFAEGARCWDGVTRDILPSTGKMIKTARCGLVTYRIEGGYFVSPRWSGKTRRGRLHGAPVRVYTAEELAGMTVDEINAAIVSDLHEDAYERQLAEPRRYKGRNLAEKLENFLFLCPQCGEVDGLRSRGDEVTCSHCGLTFRYTEYGMLEGLDGFSTVRELAAWQEEEVARAAERGAVYTAGGGTLARVAKHEETPVDSGPIRLSADTLTCGGTELPLSDIANMTMHGARAIVFSVPGGYYELIPDEGFNTLKFEMLYWQYKSGRTAVV